MMKTDWHIHTTASDGVFSAKQILHMGFEAGLSQIAISDHDTLDGWFSLDKESMLPPIDVTPAIEFGATLSKGAGMNEEIHLLAYGINPESDEILEKLSMIRLKRKERFFLLVEKAKQNGFLFSLDEMDQIVKEHFVLGRPQLANLLVQKGYFATISEAFGRYLGAGKPGYVPRFLYPVEELASLIRRNSGIVVLAHPFQIRSKQLRNSLLVSEWLDGVEVFYPSHSEEETLVLFSICKTYQKYATGGSDFHGTKGREPEQLGCFIPEYQCIEKFIKRIEDSPYRRRFGSKE